MNRSVFICVSLSVVFAALFVADTNGLFVKTGNPIAQISEVTRTVRRLPNDGLTWDRARKGALLEIGDTISTGDRAEAKIEFNAGGLLTLDSGSMVVLSGDKEELQLNFLTGAARLQITQAAQSKIKVTQPLSKFTNGKQKRIRSAVEVMTVEKITAPPVQAAKIIPTIKSELNDATPAESKVLIFPPQLFEPKAETHYPYPKGGSLSVQLSWFPVNKVKSYHLYVENGSGTTVFDDDVNGTKHTLENLEPGHYQWSVYSISESLQFSESSQSRNFVLEDVPKVHWVSTFQNQTYYYTTPKPTLKSAWVLEGRMAEQNPQFLLSLKSTSDEKISFNSRSFSQVTNVPKDGVYEETVELLSEDGKILGSSPQRKVTVAIYPLLPPPLFNDRGPASIQALRNGSVQIGWSPVAKAAAYAIEITDSKNHLFKKDKILASSYLARGLLPGDYFVKLATTDVYGRIGPFGQPKKIHVPSISDVKGPSFKKFEIK